MTAEAGRAVCPDFGRAPDLTLPARRSWRVRIRRRRPTFGTSPCPPEYSCRDLAGAGIDRSPWREVRPRKLRGLVMTALAGPRTRRQLGQTLDERHPDRADRTPVACHGP